MVEDDLADVAALGDELLRIQRRRAHVYPDAVLENSAFRILWVLADGEPRTLAEVGAALGLEQSTVSRQVGAATDAGWLERLDRPGSKSRPVRPTAAGRAAYEADGRLRADLIRTTLDRLGPERARALVEHLRDFNDAWDDVTSGSGGTGR